MLGQHRHLAHAAGLRLTLIVADGRNIPNLRSLLAGGDFEGTVIGPD